MRIAMYVLLAAAMAALLWTVAVATGWIPSDHKVARHWQTALWAVLLILSVHTLILFYFLATGKQLRVLMETSGRGVDRDHLIALKGFKSRVFPWVMWALAATIVAFIVGGGVLVGAIPPWIHRVLGILTVGTNLVATAVEIACIQRNSRIIHAIEAEYLPR
jgi:hypothetical protein